MGRLHLNMRGPQTAIFGILVYVLLFLTSPVVFAQDTGASSGRLPMDPDVRMGTLQNGLRLYIRANREPEKRAELRLVINAGSILEDEDQRGLAHFVEHMAFNGTQHFPKQELIAYLESIGMRFGADINASTSFDETVYTLTIPVDSAIFVTAIQVLRDWASAISFDPDEIEQERNVVIEERRLRRGAVMRFMESEIDVLLRGSRYADRLPIGTLENLRSFSHEALIRFYNDWYRPDLMAVVAVGDFDVDHVESLIRDSFETFQAGESSRIRPVYPVPDPDSPIVSILTDPEAAGAKLSLHYTHPAHERGTMDALRQDIVVSLFNSLLSNRLDEKSRQPDAPFLQAYSYQGQIVRTKEEFVLGAGVSDGGIKRGLEALLIELERAIRFGFTQTELDRQKRFMLRLVDRHYQERENQPSPAYAAQYVNHFLFGFPALSVEQEYTLYHRFVPDITLDELNRLARTRPSDSNFALLVQAPEQLADSLPDETELLSVFEGVRNASIDPYDDHITDRPLLSSLPRPGSIIKEEVFEDVGITRWDLPNGARVYLKPTDFKDDEIIFAAQSPGGTSLSTDADHVAALTASAIAQESGVGHFDRTSLEKRMAGVAVSVIPWIDRLREGLSGSVSPEDVEALFQLIHLYITSPRFDSSSFVVYRDRMQDLFTHRSARPESVFADTIRTTLSRYHWRDRPWSRALFGEMNLPASARFYRDRFGDAGDFSFFFVGAFTPGDLRELTETYLGSLPSAGRDERWRDEGIKPPTGIIKKTVRQGIEPKSRVQLVFTGPFEWTRSNRYRFSALNGVLQLLLRESLREDLGGTYTIGVSGSTRLFPDPSYRITISFGCAPDRSDELIATVFSHIKNLQSGDLSGEYLQRIQASHHRAYEVNLQNNRYWLRAIQQYDFYGGDLRNILNYPELVSELTTEHIREAANQYFNLNNYVQVVLLPE